jgi:glycosyltransferase involved in cell wall biosynthesis
MGHLAGLAGERLGLPSVISVHDDFSIRRNLRLYGPAYLASARGVYQLLHYARFNRAMFKRVSRVICAYPFVCRWVDRYAPEKRTIILNRVYLDQFQPQGDHALAGPLRVLNLGRQFAGKDPRPIIRAAVQLGLRLTVVGDGPLHGQIEGLVQKLGATGRVRLIKAVPHRGLPALLAEHDAFAMNLRQPGVCIPILEALAAGLPVVVNRPLFKDGLDLVGEHVLQVADRPAGYAQALARLANDEGLRQDLARQGRDLVAGVSGEIMERREADLYRELLGLPSAGGEGPPRP